MASAFAIAQSKDLERREMRATPDSFEKRFRGIEGIVALKTVGAPAVS